MIQLIIEKYSLDISIESMQELMDLLECKKYKKDDVILNQGQISRYMYIVKKGMIRQYYYKDGRDITEHFSCEGDIATCIESLFLRKPTNISIEAIEDSEIYLLDYDMWCSLSDKKQEINILLRKILENKLVVSQLKADSWRFESSSERYQRFCREYPGVVKRASVYHIASYLLMAPETLSRVRSEVLK